VAVGINLEHHSFAGHVRSRARNLGRGSAARPTPLGPEIHQYGHGYVLDDFVEQWFIHSQWFGQGRYRRSARPAAAAICKMLRRDAILLSAMVARSDYRHRDFSEAVTGHSMRGGALKIHRPASRHIVFGEKMAARRRVLNDMGTTRGDAPLVLVQRNRFDCVASFPTQQHPTPTRR
jgi:hypothetical protein